MSKEKPTYTVHIENENGIERCFVAFIDGLGARQEAEIPHAIYIALEECRKHENRQAHFVERHVEQVELSEAQLQLRMICQPKTVGEHFEEQEKSAKLQAAIESLPEIQRRRFLFYEDGLTYKQIAVQEGCSKTAVFGSIKRATEKIREKIIFFEKQG